MKMFIHIILTTQSENFLKKQKKKLTESKRREKQSE